MASGRWRVVSQTTSDLITADQCPLTTPRGPAAGEAGVARLLMRHRRGIDHVGEAPGGFLSRRFALLSASLGMTRVKGDV